MTNFLAVGAIDPRLVVAIFTASASGCERAGGTSSRAFDDLSSRKQYCSHIGRNCITSVAFCEHIALLAQLADSRGVTGQAGRGTEDTSRINFDICVQAFADFAIEGLMGTIADADIGFDAGSSGAGADGDEFPSRVGACRILIRRWICRIPRSDIIILASLAQGSQHENGEYNELEISHGLQ